MSWTQTKSSSPGPRPAQPNDMVKGEFIALDRGLLKHPSTVMSWRCLTAAPGSDASAIHGRLGARVALLQSPILPAAILPYPEKEPFRNLPVDKPHTCDLEPFEPEKPKRALYVVLAHGPRILQAVCFDLAHFRLPVRHRNPHPGRKVRTPAGCTGTSWMAGRHRCQVGKHSPRCSRPAYDGDNAHGILTNVATGRVHVPDPRNQTADGGAEHNYAEGADPSSRRVLGNSVCDLNETPDFPCSS